MNDIKSKLKIIKSHRPLIINLNSCTSPYQSILYLVENLYKYIEQYNTVNSIVTNGTISACFQDYYNFEYIPPTQEELIRESGVIPRNFIIGKLFDISVYTDSRMTLFDNVIYLKQDDTTLTIINVYDPKKLAFFV